MSETPYTRILYAGQQYVLASDYARLRGALEQIRDLRPTDEAEARFDPREIARAALRPPEETP